MSENQQDTLQDVILQTEMLRVKLEMEQLFSKNMIFFQEIHKEIYDEYKGYAAKAIWPIYTDDGYINLQNGKDESLIYPVDPVQYSNEVVENFLEHPFFREFDLGVPIPTSDLEDRTHVLNINKSLELVKLNEENKLKLGSNPESMRLMLMRGIGLGYQIEKLINSVDIHYLCLIEPNKDIFFASLHTLDYRKLYAHFQKKGYGLNLIVGVDEHLCYKYVFKYMLKIGVHNIVRYFEFDHLCSKELEKLGGAFAKGVSESFKSLGFFDDERVGLAHTVHNLKENPPILVNSDFKTDVPVFICANGPSLDKAKDFLIENQNKAIIISGGSTLGALYKMGIKPDFHVENERTYAVHTWVENSSDYEYRKDIQFLGLNTIHPKVVSEFKNVAFGMKPNDAGGAYFSSAVNDDFKYLVYSNPTVSNTVVSFALAMGFKNLYFFGLDFGFSPEGEHHSKYSQYSNFSESHVKNNPIYDVEINKNNVVRGNFNDLVIATPTFMSSKSILEDLLREHKDASIFNCSYGAWIEGATPLKYYNIKINEVLNDKKSIVEKVMQENFSQRYSIDIFHEDNVKIAYAPLVDSLKLIKKFLEDDKSTPAEAYEILENINQLLQILIGDAGTQNTFFMIKGTVQSFTMLLGGLLEQYSSDASIELFGEIVNIFNQVLDDMMRIIDHELLDLDHFEDLAKEFLVKQ